MPIKVTLRNPKGLGRLLAGVAGVALASTAYWVGAQAPARPASGKDIFRFDTFGNETFWTDTLRLHETIAKAVDPTTALSVGPEGGRGRAAPGDPEDGRPEEPRHHDRAAQAERGRGRQGHGGHQGRQGRPDAGGHHLRAVPLHGGRLGDAGDRQAAGRPAQPHPQPGGHHRALARSRRGQEGGLQLLGPGQVRPALQPGREERARWSSRPPSAWPA